MHFPLARVLAVLALASAPALAHAGMYKCVSPKGVIIFSDRPCEIQNGEKVAEMKDDAAFAAVQARENSKNVAQACLALSRRVIHCHGSIDITLMRNMREQCLPVVTRFQQSMRRELVEDERSYRELLPAEARCDALQAETWDFVKANFARKISEQDMKTIEYNVAAVPSDGRTPDLSVRRRNRN